MGRDGGSKRDRERGEVCVRERERRSVRERERERERVKGERVEGREREVETKR